MAETKLPASQIVDADIVTEAELNAGTKPASFTTVAASGAITANGGLVIGSGYTLTLQGQGYVRAGATRLSLNDDSTLPVVIGEGGGGLLIGRTTPLTVNKFEVLQSIAATAEQVVDGIRGVSKSTANIGSAHYVWNTLNSNYAGTANMTGGDVVGLFTVGVNSSAYSVPALYGIRGYAQITGNGGTSTNLYGIYAGAGTYHANATATNSYGLYITSLHTGTNTNAYGIYVEDQFGTNTWGLYQAGTNDLNILQGNTVLGDTVDDGSHKLQVEGATDLRGAVSYSGIQTVTANYTATTSDHIIAVDTTTNAVTVTLPAGILISGREIIIKDVAGNAATNNITVSPASGLIDGAASLTISANWGKTRLGTNATDWFIF